MLGIFELLGGHVEYGESLEKGLKREFKEEFDAEIKVSGLIYAFTYINPSQKSHSVEIIFLATLEDDETITLDPTNHSAQAWIGEDEIDNYFGQDDNKYQVIKAGFKEIKLLR